MLYLSILLNTWTITIIIIRFLQMRAKALSIFFYIATLLECPGILNFMLPYKNCRKRVSSFFECLTFNECSNLTHVISY